MSLADAFATIALNISAAFEGPYHDARVITQPVLETDDGGSIVVPDEEEDQPAIVARTCSVQVDAVTESMRREAGYTADDMRLLVLAATLSGSLDTDATVEVLAGPHAGVWKLASVSRDPMNIYWEARGRRV